MKSMVDDEPVDSAKCLDSYINNLLDDLSEFNQPDMLRLQSDLGEEEKKDPGS